MSRVLLFTQSGSERPKCVGHALAGRDLPSVRGRCPLVSADGATWYGTERIRREQLAAKDWWLVECENADAGRRVIAGTNVYGARILAQGGKPA